MFQVVTATTRVVGTIPTHGIAIRGAGEVARGVEVVMGLEMGAAHGEVVVIRTLAITGNRVIAGGLVGIRSSIVITVPHHTT